MTEYADTQAERLSAFHALISPVKVFGNRKKLVVDYCKDRNVLHIGCVGSGSVKDRLQDKSHLHYLLGQVAGSLTGIDKNDEGLKTLHQAGFERCYRLDIENEMIDGTIIKNIDMIVIPEVMEHLSNPGKFLDNLKALNFTGELLISVPNAFSYRVSEFIKNNRIEIVHPDHKYYFSLTTLKTLLANHGFSIMNQWFYYWPSDDVFGREFENVLKDCPYLAEGIIALAKDNRQIVDKRPDVQKCIAEGERQFQTEDYAAAEKSFLDVLESDPLNIEAYNNLGVMAFLRQDTSRAVEYFTRSLAIDPFYQDALVNFCDVLRSLHLLHEAISYLEAALMQHPHSDQLRDLLREAKTDAQKKMNKTERLPWKLYYSPGIAMHGENARQMLGLEHYIPALHLHEPVWFFGLYFDYDYQVLRAHQGRKIVNWRGADVRTMSQIPERIKIIQSLPAVHVCQARHQKDLLAELGIKAVVRPMLNRPFKEINLLPLPSGLTHILAYWRSGDDAYIQANLFFDIAACCPDITFHIVGRENADRFTKPGMQNLVFHGFLSEEELDCLMAQCKGTLRPWIWDGNPNIQTRMLLKGRYAAHSCRFEKVAQCVTVEDYVQWIHRLQQIEQPNVEAREWWLAHLNQFDFLQADFNPDKAD